MSSKIILVCFYITVNLSIQCDIGPADLFFVVTANHKTKTDVFAGVKDFMRKFVDTLDIGRAPENVRVGVILFDNIRQPQVSIELNTYGRTSDLKTSISNLNIIACGSWCKERINSSSEIIDFAIEKFPSNSKRMQKIVLISDGISMDEDYLNIEKKNINIHNIQILQIVIMENKIQGDHPYYNYYYAYNDPYKRYVERMAQLYPNYTLPSPVDPVAPKYSNQIQKGRITVGEVSALISLSDDVCNGIFTCPPCEAMSTIETSIDTQPETVASNPISTVTGPATNTTGEDYEYEITADPPGLIINNNPAKDKRSNKSINEGKSVEKRRRHRRSTRKQSECICESTTSFSTDPATVSVDSTSSLYGSAPSPYSSAHYSASSYGTAPFYPYSPCPSRPCRAQYPCFGSSCSPYVNLCHNCQYTVPIGYGNSYSNPCSGCSVNPTGSACNQPPCASQLSVTEVAELSAESNLFRPETAKTKKIDDNGTTGTGKKEEAVEENKLIENYRFKKDSGVFGIRRIAAESLLLIDSLRPSLSIPNIKIKENNNENMHGILQELLNVKAPDGGSRLVSINDGI